MFRHLLPVACILAAGVLLSAPDIFGADYRYGHFGTPDFIEYWSAFQLAHSGRNPYDPALLMQMEHSLGYEQNIPLMMWNPPWLLVLLSPVLIFPFHIAARLWLVCNILLTLGIGTVLGVTFSRQRAAWPYGLWGTILFFPVWVNLQLGQMGILMAAASALLFWSILRNRHWLAGMAVAILTLKIHASYLILIALLCWIIRRRDTKLLLASAGALALLLLASEVFFPNVIAAWITQLFAVQGAQYVAPLAWQVPTLTGFARALLSEGNSIPLWPLVVIPGGCAVLLSYFLLLRGEEIVWKEFFPILVLFSIFTAPFGWIFDYAPALLVQVAIIYKVYEVAGRQRSWMLGALAALQLAAFVWHSCCVKFQHEYLWYPAVLLTIYFASRFVALKPSE